MNTFSNTAGITIRKAHADDVPAILDLLELTVDSVESVILPDPARGWLLANAENIRMLIIENKWHFFIMETSDLKLMYGLSIINRTNYAKQLYLTPAVEDTELAEHFNNVAECAATGIWE